MQCAFVYMYVCAFEHSFVYDCVRVCVMSMCVCVCVCVCVQCSDEKDNLCKVCSQTDRQRSRGELMARDGRTGRASIHNKIYFCPATIHKSQ